MNMKKIKYKSTRGNLELFEDDIFMMVDAFAKEGYEVSLEDACLAWEEYSDSFCAGWLCMGKKGPTKTEIDKLLTYFIEVE